MSKLIINENPLLILPSLAVAIGLNEAIILQQIHYWLDPRINNNKKMGKLWVYNTYNQWSKQFPFWSEVTIRRSIKSLEDKQLLISDYFNQSAFSNQKWYTIDYTVLSELEYSLKEKQSIITSDHFDHTPDQNDQIERSNRSSSPIKVISSNIDTKNTTKNTKKSSLSLDSSSKINNNFETKINFSTPEKENERENEMLKIWNEVVEEKNEAKIKLTPKREQLLNLRLKDFFNDDISEWKNFCKKIASSKFLMGEITKFKVQLDWTLIEDNLLKIIENSYGIGDRLVDNDNSVNVIEEVVNDPIWRRVREELKNQLGEGMFKSWISKLSFQIISENVAHFIVPTKFIKEWIITNFSNEIKQKFIECGTNIQGIFIQVEENK